MTNRADQEHHQSRDLVHAVKAHPQGSYYPPLCENAKTVVAIWNELAPYRLHFLKRVRREAPEIRLVNVFTHSVVNNSMPWAMDVPPEIDVRHDPSCRAHFGVLANWESVRLHRWTMEILRKERPVLALIAGHDELSRWLTLLRAPGLGLPLVHHSDSNIFSQPRPGGLRSSVRSLYLRTIMSRVSAVMPAGTAGRAYYRCYARRAVPEYLCPLEPNYVELENGDSEAEATFRATHGLSENRRRFLSSGRLVPVKQISMLIDAFATIANEAHDWDLLIAGGGPLREQLESRVPAGLRNRVKFLGFLQSGELRHCYRSCDALVHAAADEPWGLVINEAVASGLAVIATDITGAAIDLVRHNVNGFLTPPGSPESMSAAMLAMSQGDTCARLRGNARRCLRDWRTSADPVDGLRAAVQHFTSDV